MERAKEIKASFAASNALTLHWDGKMMQDITGNKKIERLPILVSGSGSVKIIAIPKLSDCKAGPTSEAITSAAAEWALNDNVVAMCFDTTPVNTGEHTGVCVRLE